MAVNPRSNQFKELSSAEMCPTIPPSFLNKYYTQAQVYDQTYVAPRPPAKYTTGIAVGYSAPSCLHFSTSPRTFIDAKKYFPISVANTTHPQVLTCFQPYLQPCRHLQPLHTNLCRPAGRILSHTAPTVQAKMGSWNDQIFSDSDENGFKEWKVQTPDICYPAKDAQDWEVPSLINGEDETSPTTSFNAWTPIPTPSENHEDAKVVMPFGNYETGGSFSKGAQEQVSIYSDTTMSMISPFDQTYHSLSQPYSNDAGLSDSEPWSWPASYNTNECGQGNYWGTTSPSTLSTLAPVSRPNLGTDVLPPFDSTLASQQMSHMGYNVPCGPAVGIQTQQEGIIPGLLSSTLTNNQPIARDASVVSTIPDGDYIEEYDSTSPSDATTLITLASQREDDDDDPPRPASPFAQRRSQMDESGRNERDSFLLESRRKGLSYKEIKRRGGFTEAESTLRGRVRILSKPKHERVRKPQWRHQDVMLLRRAVGMSIDVLTDTSGVGTTRHGHAPLSKLPWKKIADWMRDNGASYPFAPATCAKKWEQIMRASL